MQFKTPVVSKHHPTSLRIIFWREQVAHWSSVSFARVQNEALEGNPDISSTLGKINSLLCGFDY